MKADEILRCSVCSGEVGMLRIVEGYAMLGHLRQPDPIHPVRLASGGSHAMRVDINHQRGSRPSHADTAKGRGAREVPGSDPTDAIPVASNLRAIPAPASEAGLTPAAPRVGNAAGRRRSTRRRVSPASAA